MNYLTELAEKLVTTHEDEENLREWIPFSDRAKNRATLISALAIALEKEVNAGRLSGMRDNRNGMSMAGCD